MNNEPNSPTARPNTSAEPVSLVQAQSEMLLSLLSFLVIGLWVVGVSFALGRREGGSADQPVPTVMGLPSWVVWGMMLPWLIATLATVAYALLGMPDQSLEPNNRPLPAGESAVVPMGGTPDASAATRTPRVAPTSSARHHEDQT